MTLNIPLAGRGAAVLVTDRLLTRDSVEYDRQSNKNILFAGRDGIIALGYTGLGYVDGVTSDQWLAEVLIGERYDRSGPPTLGRLGGTIAFRSIGDALRGLRQAVATARVKVASSHRDQWTTGEFAVAVTGWQWNHRYVRPIMAVLVKPRGVDDCQLLYAPRFWWVDRQWIFRPVPYSTCTDDHRRVIVGLMQDARDWTDVENALVAGVRLSADLFPTVGRDCMVIRMDPPGRATATARFVAEAPGTVKETVRVGYRTRKTLPVAYTPWLIGPGAVHAPGQMIGNTVYGLGHYSVTVHGAPPSGHIMGAASSQRRRPAP